MATVYPVCQGEIITVTGSAQAPFQCYADSTHTTLGTWIFKAEPSTDFSGLISLLSFDSDLCGQLIGGCLVIFIIGFSAGKVARILTRR